jgi:hypothetical protein
MDDVIKIPTAQLCLSDVPANAGRWVESRAGPLFSGTLVGFALSFNGYEFLGLEVLSFAGETRRIYELAPQVLECFATTGLRALLFVEQRRWAKDDDSEIETSPYVRDIVRHIRGRLA